MSLVETLIAYGRIADRLTRPRARARCLVSVLALAFASAGLFNVAASRAATTAPAATLPTQGVFESCHLDSELQTCEQRLQAMAAAGLQVVVMPAMSESLDSLSAYASQAHQLGMSVMWEISNPTWWQDPSTSTKAAGAFQAFATACGCNQNGPLLAYTIDWLARLPGTYGYYAADDSMLAPGDQAGVASYVAQIKQQDVAHTVMIGAYGQQQGSSYEGIADVIGAENYPVTASSLMPVGSHQSAWNSVAQWASQTQQAADAAGKQSAFILQAFTWGDNLADGEAVGACTPADTRDSCYAKLTYPTPGDQLQLRNEVLLNAHPKLILWFSFPGTYGQAGNDTYSSYPTGETATARLKGLTQAIQAPYPTSPPPTTATTSNTTQIPAIIPLKTVTRRPVLRPYRQYSRERRRSRMRGHKKANTTRRAGRG